MCRKTILLVLFVSAVGLTLTRAVGAADPTLVGWWRFDEGTGTTVADSSGKGNTGTIVGSPTWTTDGKLGGAMQFPASGYVDCGTGSSLAIGDAVSMTAWIKVGALGIDHKVGGNQNNANGGYKMSVYTNNEVEFEIRTSANNATLNRTVAGGTVFQTGVWYHVVGVYSKSDGIIRTYVNGVLDREMTTTDVLGVSPGPMRIGCEPYTPGSNNFNGVMDDVRVYSRAVAEAEISAIMLGTPPGPAQGASPGPAATDVPRDVVLGWKPGEFAKTHDVYLGTWFDDVNNAARTAPGDVLVSQGQDANAYDPAGLLAFGQTYYWRVDEVNAPPDSTIFKGDTWSFTTETYGYAVKPIKATASGSMAATMGPDKTIDGSGLDSLDQHSVSASQMWLSKKNQSPIWIQYEFDKVYKLHQMWVWNSNQAVETSIGFGADDVTVETSLDGTTWTALDGVPEFAQATGEPNYVHNTTVDFGGVQAKYVKLTITSNWAGTTKQSGLSEVRFFYVPVKAFGPTPASGATGVALNGTLNWRPGREAVKHQVYLGSDPNALSLVNTVTAHSLGLGPLGLLYGKTYYWKVNEVNDAASPNHWEGDVWSFTTIGYAVVEDFESYDDICKRIFFSWVDGFGYSASPDCSLPGSAGNGTGSTVGNVSTPFAERTIVHGGAQSMPMAYDNTKSPYYSETQREWPTAQSWTGGGVNTLLVYVRGDGPAFLETSPGTILMNGMGTDIWNAADEFRFVYKSLKGNGSIVARVDSVANTDGWAKAGVMIRERLDSGSTFAIAAATPTSTHGVTFQYRTTAAASPANTEVNMVTTPGPYWVKLTRTGDTFTAQRSVDGVAWADITVTPAVTITMASDVFIGLAVCSHVTGTVCTAKFSNVSTTGSVSGAWQMAEVGTAQANGNTPETFYVALQDNGGKILAASNPDPTVIAMGTWQECRIPLSQFTSAGVNVGSIKKMIVGIGDRGSPKAGNAGKVYIDDIRLTRVPTP